MKQLPSLTELRDWMTANPDATRRDIARAFGIKGAAKIDLKAMLRELEDEGVKPRRRSSGGALPPVTVLEVLGPDADGDVFAQPVEWRGQGAAPRVILLAPKDVGAGDRVLAKCEAMRGPDYDYQAKIIRKIGSNPQRILGLFRAGAEGGRIVPIDKGADRDWMVGPHDMNGAQDGELVLAEPMGRARFGPPRAHVVERLGDPTAPKAVSLIAIHQHGIRDAFDDAVVAEADSMGPLPLGDRLDLRDMAAGHDRPVGCARP